ncbi:hypothetical protein PV783_16905 [Chitinophaga sp. CC14]|uniref:hypothetical protein n=1 Tax=Chitinophaga sp. CC14 TaxID=3029199 RepID=UPI003B7D9DB5
MKLITDINAANALLQQYCGAPFRYTFSASRYGDWEWNYAIPKNRKYYMWSVVSPNAY